MVLLSDYTRFVEFIRLPNESLLRVWFYEAIFHQTMLQLVFFTLCSFVLWIIRWHWWPSWRHLVCWHLIVLWPMSTLRHCCNILPFVSLWAWIFSNLNIMPKRLAHLRNIGWIDALRQFRGIIPIQSIRLLPRN